MTASHSILKHLQLGADEDIKKTHPKHLCQPAVKNLLLSPASPRCRAAVAAFFWLYNSSAQDYTHSMETRPQPRRACASPGTHGGTLCPCVPAGQHLHRWGSHGSPGHKHPQKHRGCSAGSQMPNNTMIRAWTHRQGGQRRAGRGEAAAGQGGQLPKKGYSAPGSWKTMVKADDERCRNWRGDLKTAQKQKTGP